MVEEVVEKGKGVATNRNELGVEFNLKKSKPQSQEIEVVVCANKVAYTLVAKLNFLCINSQIMSVVGKMDLDRKAQSNTIYWCIYNSCLVWWLELLS
jgi:hypothetical protein